MKRPVLAAALICFGMAAVLFFGTMDAVPFHPDESSLLYQSRDLERFFQNPLALAYEPNQPTSRDMEYRALNAPLAKYILGIGRSLAGVNAAAVATDWDWQMNWQENVQAGAMPSFRALNGARAASTLMALLAIPAIAWGGYQLGGWPLGILSATLYTLNALVLLHGRRAMAEGTLLFTIALLIAASLNASKRPWLAGLAAGLAISAKHSALPLISLPLAGLLLTKRTTPKNYPSWRSWLTAGLSLVLTVLILNPITWKNPVSTVGLVIESRQQFVQDQKAITEALASGGVLDSPQERLASLIGNTLLLPPQFQEVGNYRVQLNDSIEDYRGYPLHLILAGPIQGSLLLALTLLGFWGGFRSQPFGGVKERRSKFAILAIGTAVMIAATILLNPLPYQRYYIPLIPLFVMWQATGLLALAQATRRLLATGSS